MSTSPIIISGPTTSTRPAMLADCSADHSRTAGAAPTVPRTADLTPYPSQLTASTTAKICERTSPVSLVCPRPDLLPFNGKFADSNLITVCRLYNRTLLNVRSDSSVCVCFLRSPPGPYFHGVWGAAAAAGRPNHLLLPLCCSLRNHRLADFADRRWRCIRKGTLMFHDRRLTQTKAEKCKG